MCMRERHVTGRGRATVIARHVMCTRVANLETHDEEAHAVHGNTTFLTSEQLERTAKNKQRALQRRAARKVEDGLALPAVDVDPGSIPAMPTTFQDVSQVDVAPCTLLQRLHPHPRDADVIFDDVHIILSTLS